MNDEMSKLQATLVRGLNGLVDVGDARIARLERELAEANRRAKEAETRALPVAVRHIETGVIVAAFAYYDQALRWIAHGHESCGGWRPDEIEMVPATVREILGGGK